MSNDVIEKVKNLPPEQQQEVEDFVNYLLSKYLVVTTSLNAKKTATLDWAKGKVWMANDFNNTPTEFNDYL